ncbi:MAG: Holliday junction resolvase RuvX [Anaerolineae bacterium]|nr:Holliday junction resolvase RuvX [Anaerolineae bacterium]
MRYLGLDLGDRRIGVAISDTSGMLARPLTIFQRTSRKADYAYLKDLVKQHHVKAIVVGLPFNMDGTEGKQAAWVRDYSAEMAATLEITVHLFDERLSTEEAAGILRVQGRRPKRGRLDAVAAAVILQNYLDAQRRSI